MRKIEFLLLNKIFKYKTAYGEDMYNSADACVRMLKEAKLKEIFLYGLRKELSE
jgi:hypothetical protein